MTTTDSILSITERNLKAYGQEVVEQRAVPDYRDGLKPVHRFILWSCYNLGLKYGTPFKKSARTVGDVLGKYHPHADQGTYDAMVGMAGTMSDDGKTWVTKNIKVPLIEGYGNWGDNQDPAAAMRYCFSGDTRVMTELGLIRIDSIARRAGAPKYRKQSGARLPFEHQVASLDGALPASHWVNSGKRTLYEIVTRRGFTVKATENEPFYTLGGIGFSWTELRNLRVGDMLSLKRGSDVLPKGSAALPIFKDKAKSTAQKREYWYDATAFPTHMSTELAYILGTLVSEGYAGQTVGFNTTSKAVYSKFLRCWRHVFPTIECSMHIRQPHSFGKKKSAHFCVHGRQLIRYFEHLGIKFGSYNQVVPEVMFQASKEEMSAFLSALFEGDGSVAGVFVDYHSKSRKLFQDLQNVLLNYYGVVSTVGKDKLYVTGSYNVRTLLNHLRFEAPKKIQAAQKLLSKSDCAPGNTVSDKVPEKFLSAVSDFKRSVLRPGRKFVAENGKLVDFLEAKGALNMVTRFPKISHRAVEHIYGNLDAFGKFFPKAARALQQVADRDYYYDEIVSIKKVGTDWTYDLTVPKTHAFVANGFIVHNTEARLSEFSTKYLLDPVYLAVSEYVPNYSGDDKVPLVLPAKLPVLLLNGSLSIAFGIKAECPSFEAKGVIELVKRCLAGEEITPLQCAKTLTFAPAFGGECVSERRQILDFHKHGTGSLLFSPVIEVDEKKRTVILRSSCPGLTSATSWASLMEKLSQYKEVKSVSDSTDKTGFRVEVFADRGVDVNTLLDLVEKEVVCKYNYSMGVTVREKDHVTFKRVTPAEIVKDWCSWRVKLEVKVIKYLLKQEQAKLDRLNLMLLAVDNLKIIMAALSKEDSALYLSKALKISLEDANEILDLKVRQLKSLERTKLKEQIKKVESELRSLEKSLLNPTKRVLECLSSIQL